MNTALILFAHGARDPEWANAMRRVQASIKLRMSCVPVELAFLEFMSPTLPECARQLIEQGARKVVIVPMFIARGGHLKNETPIMVELLRSTYPSVEFSLGGAIGEHDQVVEAMAVAALDVAGLPLALEKIC